MKIKKSELKTAVCAYMYDDNHVVLKHKKNDKDAGRINWVTVYEDIGVQCEFYGTLIIFYPQAVLPFLQEARRIAGRQPSIVNGSPKTQELRIPVGGIDIFHKDAPLYEPMLINWMPGVLSGDFELQAPDVHDGVYETFDPAAERWFDLKISKIHRSND